MVKLVIRDDDLSFFSCKSDVLDTYKELYDFPISFAVVPEMITNSYNGGNCKELKGNTVPKLVGENVELVETLKQRIVEHKAEILLHGRYHTYKLIDGTIRPECLWWSKKECETAIAWGKEYLEKTFGTKVKWFVAPSNQVCKETIDIVEKNGLNYSGIISFKKDRRMSFKYIRNYIIRWGTRLFTSFGYPDVLDYDNHKEVYACPIVEGQYLYKMYEYCKRHNCPMVINSHYWDIRDNENSKKTLFDFVKFAIKDGACPSLISDLL